LINQKNILEQKVFNEELNKLKQSIKNYSSEKKNTIDKINQENKTGLSILSNEINTILSEYSLENNIDIILNKNTVILGKKELDITNEILTRLNKKIKKINYK
jgi:Skp family chaperone for outer membrane proteins